MIREKQMEKLCKNCKHWEQLTFSISTVISKSAYIQHHYTSTDSDGTRVMIYGRSSPLGNCKKCAKSDLPYHCMGDGDVIIADEKLDVVYYDSLHHSAHHFTGENFGCIH